MAGRRMKAGHAAAAALALAAAPAGASDGASWAGLYEGYVVCDNVAGGVASSFARTLTFAIAQEGDAIHVATRLPDGDSLGDDASLYHGLVMTSPGGEIASGFLEACRPRFPYKEMVRIFPATPREEGFSFSATTVFVSDSLPGSDGVLLVESCMWSARRVSPDPGEVERCAGPPAASPER